MSDDSADKPKFYDPFEAWERYFMNVHLAKWTPSKLMAERVYADHPGMRPDDVGVLVKIVEALENQAGHILVVGPTIEYINWLAAELDYYWTPRAHGRKYILEYDHGQIVEFLSEEQLRGASCGKAVDKVILHPWTNYRTAVAILPCEQPRYRHLSSS